MAKRGDSKASTGILRAALDACRRHMGFVVLFSAALNLLYLAPSIYMLQVYDRVLTSGGVLTLLYLSAVLVGSLATLSFLDAVRMRLLATLAKRFDRLVAPHVLMSALQREGRSRRRAGPCAARIRRPARSGVRAARRWPPSMRRGRRFISPSAS